MEMLSRRFLRFVSRFAVVVLHEHRRYQIIDVLNLKKLRQSALNIYWLPSPHLPYAQRSLACLNSNCAGTGYFFRLLSRRTEPVEPSTLDGICTSPSCSRSSRTGLAGITDVPILSIASRVMSSPISATKSGSWMKNSRASSLKS